MSHDYEFEEYLAKQAREHRKWRWVGWLTIAATIALFFFN